MVNKIEIRAHRQQRMVMVVDVKSVGGIDDDGTVDGIFPLTIIIATVAETLKFEMK